MPHRGRTTCPALAINCRAAVPCCDPRSCPAREDKSLLAFSSPFDVLGTLFMPLQHLFSEQNRPGPGSLRSCSSASAPPITPWPFSAPLSFLLHPPPPSCRAQGPGGRDSCMDHPTPSCALSSDACPAPRRSSPSWPLAHIATTARPGSVASNATCSHSLCRYPFRCLLPTWAPGPLPMGATATPPQAAWGKGQKSWPWGLLARAHVKPGLLKLLTGARPGPSAASLRLHHRGRRAHLALTPAPSLPGPA